MTALMVAVLAAGAPDTLWANVTSGGVYSTVEVDDLNGDGIPDVVSGVNFWDDEPTLWCLSGADGDTLWTSDQYKGIYRDKGLTGVPDIDGDGYGDILIATPGGYAPPGRSLILVSGADGSLIWQWSAYENVPSGAGWGYSCAVMDDWTGDGLPEFLGGFGTTGSAYSAVAACLDGATGDTLWTRVTADAVMDILTVPDMTGDGIQEVILGIGGNSYTNSTVEMVDGSTGEPVWSAVGGGDVMALSAVDRGDTVPWVVSSSFNGHVRCHSLGGELIWESEIGGMLLDVEAGPDLNGDGIAEIAVAGDNLGTLCLDGATGATLWAYPTGSNTWSVAWADSVCMGAEFVPCVAGGSVNGRKVTLVNALTGGLVWEEDFTERVYNVSTVRMETVSPSPVVLVGLQDQQPQPFHAWAFLSSSETSAGEAGQPVPTGSVVRTNPSAGTLFLAPPEGEWECGIYDLSGRLVWSDTITGDRGLDVSSWGSGVFLVVMRNGDMRLSRTVTVLN